MAAPDTSFGPRWSAVGSTQNQQCLACHADNVGAHWSDSRHMEENLTCVTCHSMHQSPDPATDPGQQTQLCTTCHKVQKAGIHDLRTHLQKNPACTTCHNPHADQSAVAAMLRNDSAGCRSCHNLAAMAGSAAVSAKAKGYHKVMAQPDRTCLDCHQGVAHGPIGSTAPFVPAARSSGEITLFYPGQSDIEWILGEHAGAQPFRQGTNCQQCHRDEEAVLGAALGSAKPTSRSLQASFNQSGSELVLELSWAGDEHDVDIALMWGDDGNAEFRRGGCWAACHSDMDGMSRDRDLELGKYLAVSRQGNRQIGQSTTIKSSSELAALMEQGNFVEMWRVTLDSGHAASATLLADLRWQRATGLQVQSSYEDGRWRVVLRRKLNAGEGRKNFTDGSDYTFGIALHSAHRPGALHWVSLPMTFSLDREDTDFHTR
jgi:predicted CXXCH cytochrome family protein